MEMRLNICIIKTGKSYNSLTFSEKQEDMILGKTKKSNRDFRNEPLNWYCFQIIRQSCDLSQPISNVLA